MVVNTSIKWSTCPYLSVMELNVDKNTSLSKLIESSFEKNVFTYKIFNLMSKGFDLYEKVRGWWGAGRELGHKASRVLERFSH